MGKITKLLGLPQVMECPQCLMPMEPKRTMTAKLIGVASVAAAGALATVTAGFGALLGAAAAREYLCDRKGIHYKCANCGFTYSEAEVQKRIEAEVRERMEAEGEQHEPAEFESQWDQTVKRLEVIRWKKQKS